MNESSVASAAEVVAFWRDAVPEAWFKIDDRFDDSIRERFLPTYEAASDGKLSSWEATSEGALALLLLLDQFPRNMFRGSARMFATDPMARAIAAAALVRGFDAEVPAELRSFFYLPFEHSENIKDQERSVALCKASGDADLLKWAVVHADIVRRFGRFPHRNVVLGRATTPEEQAFLDDETSFKG